MTVGQRVLMAAGFAGIVLAAIGTAMAFAFLFPEVTCIYEGNDGVCIIRENPLALPTLIGGVVLAIVAFAALRTQRRRATPSPKG